MGQKIGSKNLKSYGAGKGNIKRKFNGKRMDKHCDYCDVNGHKNITCFTLQGFLDCYKIGIKKSKPTSKAIPNLVNTPFDKE